ncbi:MAG TPA: hypothetical protein VN809_15610 [Telmatospirillum sp.]|nr:hypothetical protein [Telmatospirillum sp.]
MTESAETLILTYILAKDGNRPHLLRQTFAEDAELKMVLNTGAINFPPIAQSRESIADILARQFGATYENIYTFCLDRPPPGDRLASFSCDWAVGMSEKANRSVRVGCGRYDWRFSPTAPLRVEHLAITIDVMESLPPACGDEILDWLSALPYPWCTPKMFVQTAPAIAALRPVLTRLEP